MLKRSVKISRLKNLWEYYKDDVDTDTDMKLHETFRGQSPVVVHTTKANNLD